MGFDFAELLDLGKPEHSPAYHHAGAVIDYTEAVARRMDELGLSRKDLAERLGTSQAYVTKLLSGHNNFTLETMTKVALALGCEVTVGLQELRELGSVPVAPAAPEALVPEPPVRYPERSDADVAMVRDTDPEPTAKDGHAPDDGQGPR